MKALNIEKAHLYVGIILSLSSLTVQAGVCTYFNITTSTSPPNTETSTVGGKGTVCKTYGGINVCNITGWAWAPNCGTKTAMYKTECAITNPIPDCGY